jgi:hypothetical protein
LWLSKLVRCTLSSLPCLFGAVVPRWFTSVPTASWLDLISLSSVNCPARLNSATVWWADPKPILAIERLVLLVERNTSPRSSLLNTHTHTYNRNMVMSHQHLTLNSAYIKGQPCPGTRSDHRYTLFVPSKSLVQFQREDLYNIFFSPSLFLVASSYDHFHLLIDATTKRFLFLLPSSFVLKPSKLFEKLFLANRQFLSKIIKK